MGVRISEVFFKKNGPSPASFSFIFGLFKQTIQIFTTNQCEKMSCPSSIRRRDSNPRPLERESPPITTRPGLPPEKLKLLGQWLCLSWSEWLLPTPKVCGSNPVIGKIYIEHFLSTVLKRRKWPI